MHSLVALHEVWMMHPEACWLHAGTMADLAAIQRVLPVGVQVPVKNALEKLGKPRRSADLLSIVLASSLHRDPCCQTQACLKGIASPQLNAGPCDSSRLGGIIVIMK